MVGDSMIIEERVTKTSWNMETRVMELMLKLGMAEKGD